MPLLTEPRSAMESTIYEDVAPTVLVFSDWIISTEQLEACPTYLRTSPASNNTTSST